MKRTLCLILALLMLIPLVSCSGDSAETEVSTDVSPTADNEGIAAEAEEETEETMPPLPAMDMDGFTLRVSNVDPAALSWANITIAAEQDGTPVNDAIY